MYPDRIILQAVQLYSVKWLQIPPYDSTDCCCSIYNSSQHVEGILPICVVHTYICGHQEYVLYDEVHICTTVQ